MNKQILFIYLFIIAGISIVARIAPHPANFAPIGALALFAGAYASQKSRWWLLAPLGAMFFSDVFIGFYDWRIMTVVYGSFAMYGVLGVIAGKHKNSVALFGSNVVGSVVFYLATNAAVWAFSPLYEKTASGLSLAYLMGIPFFKNTLLGDLLYSGIFLGGYALITNFTRVFSRGELALKKAR